MYKKKSLLLVYYQEEYETSIFVVYA